MAIFYPNTTQTPNFIFDELMADKSIGELEFKIICAVVRKTYGWHKDEDAISVSQLMSLTGGSRRGIIYAMKRLLTKGIIIRTGKGFGRESSKYKLLVVQSMHQSKESEVQALHLTGATSDATVRTAQVHSVVQPVHPQNTKNGKYKNQKGSNSQFLSYSVDKHFRNDSENNSELNQTGIGGASEGKTAVQIIKAVWNGFLKLIEGRNFTPTTIERFKNFNLGFEPGQVNIFSETNKFDRAIIESYFSKHKIAVSYQQEFEDVVKDGLNG